VALTIYGDPDELDAVARRLTQRAMIVRQHADDHVRRGQAARWVSTSAQAYRDKVAADRIVTDQAAAEMERAAAVLRAHAQDVRERVAMIARYEREATAWFDRQARSLLHRTEDVVTTAGHVIEKAVSGEPPWSRWPFGPLNLPVPGDLQWLEVGQFMRREGAI
jgi:hypothetical protein